MRVLPTACLAGVLLLSSGCATFQNGGDIAPIVVNFVHDVQRRAVAICGFEPLVGTINAIAAADVGMASSAAAMAALICRLVMSGGTVPQAGRALAYYRGIPIQGRFVR